MVLALFVLRTLTSRPVFRLRLRRLDRALPPPGLDLTSWIVKKWKECEPFPLVGDSEFGVGPSSKHVITLSSPKISFILSLVRSVYTFGLPTANHMKRSGR